jgi:demethylmenaquinone methyltransferase / 2-methoxy-6-polyprenyl-1,4-benzoquinol methylase
MSTSLDKSADRVQRMFGQIARRYDLLNRLLSLGIDRSWRRRTAHLLIGDANGENDSPRIPVLDVCTGTADLALAFWRATRGRAEITGADFCPEMLEIGREKCRRAGAADRVELIEADALQLPFEDSAFQIVCVAFGLRNLSDADAGLREMVRVCRPGGLVGVLEFSTPRGWPWRSMYGWYGRHVLPRVGESLAGNAEGAYNYLPRSIGQFPQAEALIERMQAAGVGSARQHRFTFGIASLYIGKVEK